MHSRPESAPPGAANAGPAKPRFALLALQAGTGLLLMGLAWGRFPEFYQDPVRDLAVLFALVPTLALLGTSGAGRGVKHEAERGYLVIANTVWNLTLLPSTSPCRTGMRSTRPGLYAHIRHPSYLGLLLIMLGLGLVFESLLGVVATVASGLMIQGRMRREERFPLEQFGDDYRAYMARTKRLVPGIY